MNKTYDFKSIEKGTYDHWKKRGFFESGKDVSKTPFTIVIPPPNVTGKLHLGHAWDQTLQDIIIRRKRMQGYDALYLPGMDHAGIATQAKVDARLKSMGTNRYELGREKFLETAWAWKEEYAEIIKKQWSAIGISVDYNKERFTLDKKLNDAVNHVFLSLYEKGYIYRDYRIISWDSDAKTALSNIEVEYKETQSKLYYFKYPLEDGSGFMEIATTRPETMFADQALMVHPDDERYLDMVGKKVFIPGTKMLIPIITDSYVDMEFGTGIVKVTPAHDPNDFEVGKRHQLDMPLCINEDGTMNDMAGKYQGLDRFECRQALVKDLNALDLVSEVKDYQNSVGYSERTGVMVEPRLSLQWFVKMDELSKEALQSNVSFVPARFRKIFDAWMTGTFDWCISRQLWWGHRIPAWYRGGEMKVQVNAPGEDWQQDEDVLDTWFSSALWPFSTLGWPEESEDYKRYYPTDVLVTGYDIIFFWVARMVFQGLEFTGKDPFKDVLIHGLIRDSNGRKMSKSLGNGVDPMDVIDKYGIDALRYFLTTNSAPGLDMRYDETKVESSWNFLNKLWHATRFVDMSTDNIKTYQEQDLSVMDKAILIKLDELIETVDGYYDKYEFGEVAKYLYHFIWDVYANTYLEYAKIELKKPSRKPVVSAVLRIVLEDIIKLLHPFVPFITDALYKALTNNDTLMIESWPTRRLQADDASRHFDDMDMLISKVRNLRSDMQVFKPLQVILKVEGKHLLDAVTETKDFIASSIKAETLTIVSELDNESDYTPLASRHIMSYFIPTDLVDPEKERQVLLEQLTALEKEIKRSEGLLNNKNFMEKAKPEKIALEKEKYEGYLTQYQAIKKKIS